MGRKGKQQVRVKDYTFRDFQEVVKQFYAWLFDVEDPRHEGYPKVVSWIRPKTPRSTLSSSDLLIPTEVNQLISATADLRMKALVAVCAECGLRVGEALRLRLRDVVVQDNYAEIAVPVKGKTGTRKALSIESLPLMCQWMDQHPDRGNPEAWLWTDDTDPLTYDRARFKLLEMKRKAKISKRLYFHLFRHTSATTNAGLGENMLREIYGWSRNSSEPSTYVHLSGETVKKALLQKAGVQQKAEAESKVIMCPRCGSPNQFDASLCIKCKSVLKLEHAISISGFQKKLEEMQTQIKQYEGTLYNVTREFMTMLVVVGEKEGDNALLKMIEDTKQRLRIPSAQSHGQDPGEMKQKASLTAQKQPLSNGKQG